jgi:hypothetical protein
VKFELPANAHSTEKVLDKELGILASSSIMSDPEQSCEAI